MNTRRAGFKTFVSSFPERAGDFLSKIPDQGGFLSQTQAQELLRELKLDREELMARLLDLARIFAVVPISDFKVGAVALARSGGKGGWGLFLGANCEFKDQPLNQSIHAEQAAVMNAWHRGARELIAVAVTDPPCGHCRQFMNEFGNKAGEIRIITPDKDSESFTSAKLSDLLPKSFGPQDLGNPEGLAALGPLAKRPDLEITSPDPLAAEALAAAVRSYAPYTGNWAGCAIQTGSGKVFWGSYVENAAYNPSLSPFHTAILRMNLNGLEEEPRIERVVLVERPTDISQKQIVETLLKTRAPRVRLEHYRARIRPQLQEGL